jgi:hypothetical protein
MRTSSSPVVPFGHGFSSSPGPGAEQLLVRPVPVLERRLRRTASPGRASARTRHRCRRTRAPRRTGTSAERILRWACRRSAAATTATGTGWFSQYRRNSPRLTCGSSHESRSPRGSSTPRPARKPPAAPSSARRASSRSHLSDACRWSNSSVRSRLPVQLRVGVRALGDRILALAVHRRRLEHPPGRDLPLQQVPGHDPVQPLQPRQHPQVRFVGDDERRLPAVLRRVRRRDRLDEPALVRQVGAGQTDVDLARNPRAALVSTSRGSACSRSRRRCCRPDPLRWRRSGSRRRSAASPTGSPGSYS